MRVSVIPAVFAVLMPLACSAPAHAAARHARYRLPRSGNINLPYPDNINLEQGSKGWTYRFHALRLYMSSADPPDQSACNDGCAKRWIPVIAASDARPVGDWTPILRQDGRRQWAFRHHAVYTYVHDSSQSAAGAMGSFHLLPYFH